MTPAADSEARGALHTACIIAGVDATDAMLIRASENVLYRLPGGVVARVARPGQQAAATKEVAVSRWLGSVGFPVAELVPGLDQPVVVEQRAITFWRELPPHQPGTPAQVGATLQRLHDLPMPPDLQLPVLDPLVRLDHRIDAARLLNDFDRRWLRRYRDELAEAWSALPSGQPWCAVHGDAWGGNIVATHAGVVVLDLERFAYGPPEWDLTAIAVDFESLADMSAQQWRDVCDEYGFDVTTWAGYGTLRAIRELRKVTFAVHRSGSSEASNNTAVQRPCLPSPAWGTGTRAGVPAGWRPSDALTNYGRSREAPAATPAINSPRQRPYPSAAAPLSPKPSSRPSSTPPDTSSAAPSCRRPVTSRRPVGMFPARHLPTRSSVGDPTPAVASSSPDVN